MSGRGLPAPIAVRRTSNAISATSVWATWPRSMRPFMLIMRGWRLEVGRAPEYGVVVAHMCSSAPGDLDASVSILCAPIAQGFSPSAADARTSKEMAAGGRSCQSSRAGHGRSSSSHLYRDALKRPPWAHPTLRLVAVKRAAALRDHRLVMRARRSKSQATAFPGARFATSSMGHLVKRRARRSDVRRDPSVERLCSAQLPVDRNSGRPRAPPSSGIL